MRQERGEYHESLDENWCCFIVEENYDWWDEVVSVLGKQSFLLKVSRKKILA
jgi:hypothetical protein